LKTKSLLLFADWSIKTVSRLHRQVDPYTCPIARIF
jgi:hypothetical protein